MATLDEDRFFGFDSDDWIDQLRESMHESPGLPGGRYEVRGEVGRGGQGVVFRAVERETSRTVALKRLLAGAFAPEPMRARFEREIELVSALSHPGIVKVLGVERDGASPLLVLEWIEGQPITRWAAGRPRNEVLECFERLCDAMQHAHQRGVLHRDLKPSNVLVDADGQPHVLDFGLARLTTDDTNRLTSTTGFVGTPAYSAPEQWLGHTLDARSDVHALGTILFELLTGRMRVEGDLAAAIALAANPGRPVRPSELERSIPAELDAIVLQATAHEPAQRYQSVDALVSDVRRFRAGRPVLAHLKGPWYLVRKAASRNPWTTALLGVLFLATSAYLVSSFRMMRDLEHQRDDALDARRAADLERSAAQASLRETEEVLSFMNDGLIRAANPALFGHPPTLLEVLRGAAQNVPADLSPASRYRIHRALGHGFNSQGSFAEAAAEVVLALQLARKFPETAPLTLGVLESELGELLTQDARYPEAERHLRAALEQLEGIEPLPLAERQGVFARLAYLCGVTGRLQEGLDWARRALAAAPDPVERARAHLAVGTALSDLGEDAASIAEYRLGLEAAEAAPQHDANLVADLHLSLGAVHSMHLRLAEAESELRQALEIKEQLLGPDHADLAKTLTTLAEVLARRPEGLEEAEELALRGVAISARGSGDSIFHALCLNRLAHVQARLGQVRNAATSVRQSLTIMEQALPITDPRVQGMKRQLHDVLVTLGDFDAAAPLLAELEQSFDGSERWWFLSRHGASRARAGDFEAAIRECEEGVELARKSAHPDALLSALWDLSDALKLSGDAEGAAEVAREARALSR